MILFDKKNIVAIILSGGRGTRLGNIDKGLQKYKGRALVNWVIEAVRPQVGKIILSINRNQKQYKELNLTTVIDQYDGSFNGPIAGILSCAEQLKTQDFAYMLIASCDSPRLTNNYVARLYDNLQNSAADAAVVNDGNRNQHLHCLIKTSAIDALDAYYNNDGRSMHGWFQQIRLTEVDFTDLSDCFININTLDELSELEKRTQ